MKKAGLYYGFIFILVTVIINSCDKDEQYDFLPPDCSIIMPADSSEFYVGDTIIVDVEATDEYGKIQMVILYIDDVGKFSAKVSPYKFKWSTINEIPGFHTIRATAFDPGGNSSSDECIINLVIRPPVVITAIVNSITNNSAMSGGNVTNGGGTTVTARGVCWSTSPDPTISDNITNDGSGTGSFISSIKGLKKGTTYYVKAYAMNSELTSYGNQVSFTTNADLPTVSTTSISSITNSSAQSGGNVTDDGGATVTAKGVCWSTFSNPTISDYITNDSSGTGSFISSITGLEKVTTYYVRGYATNNEGTAYGNEIEFTSLAYLSCPGTPTVSDYDGNEYNAVLIGSQCWMKENLKATHYSDGSQLVDGTGAGDISGDYTAKYYFAYDDDISNVATYGRLYTWAAVMNGAASSDANPSGVQGVCPAGWHVPTDAEWKVLEMYLGMSQNELDNYGGRGTDEGGKLKEIGTIHWSSPNTGATDKSCFTALPGGGRDDNDSFDYIGLHASFWSATKSNHPEVWMRNLSNYSSLLFRLDLFKSNAFSVRCIKD